MKVNIFWDWGDGKVHRADQIPQENVKSFFINLCLKKKPDSCRIVNDENGHEFTWTRDGHGWHETQPPRKGLQVNFNGTTIRKPGVYASVSSEIDPEHAKRLREEWLKNFGEPTTQKFKTPVFKGVKAKLMINGEEVAMAPDVEWTRELVADTELIQLKEAPVTITVRMKSGK